MKISPFPIAVDPQDVSRNKDPYMTIFGKWDESDAHNYRVMVEDTEYAMTSVGLGSKIGTLIREVAEGEGHELKPGDNPFKSKWVMDLMKTLSTLEDTVLIDTISAYAAPKQKAWDPFDL